MRMLRRVLLLPVFFMLLFRLEAAAQCCTAGNPVNTNCGPTASGQNLLDVTWSYMYSFSDTYYHGTKPLDKVYAESNFDYASLALSYGLTEKLRITADIGYFFDKSQRFINSDYTRYAQGISDATLGLNYRTYRSEDGLFDLAQSAKITIPVGDFNQEYDGIILPIDFQPSSGNYRYNFGLMLAKRFEGSDFSLMSFSSVEFSQAIETKNTYHKYGNLYNASVIGVYRISPYLLGLMQLRYEIRDRALNGGAANQYAYLNSSGGVIAYVSPQVAVNFFSDWTLSLQYNIPFYKNIYGEEQLTNRHSVSLNISRMFDFGGGEAEAPFADDAETYSEVQVRVSGNCEMCKDRIEGIAARMEFVRKARWDAATEVLTISYRDDKPDMDGVGRALAEAGHDAGAHSAPDDVYESLPACCHYR